MGNSNLKAVKATENIVALCDVDWGYSKKYLKQIQMQKLTGTGGRCMMKWVNQLMQ